MSSPVITGKKAIHRWVQIPRNDPRIIPDMELTVGGKVVPRPPTPEFRAYICSRCDAGPVRVDVLLNKANINRVASKSGILPDCNAEIVRRILES